MYLMHKEEYCFGSSLYDLNSKCVCDPVGIRLKAIKNIQKITKSMKMVSAAKYAKADRDLRLAKPYGVGAQGYTTCINNSNNH